MQIEKITTWERFAEIKEDWNSLFERAEPTVFFLRWEWLELWIRHFDHEDWEILLAWDGDQLVGAAPLWFSQECGGFIGDISLADYMDFLTEANRGDEVIMAFIKSLRHRPWKTLVFKRLHDGKQRADQISRLGKSMGLESDVILNCVSPFVQIDRSWEEYYQSRSRKLRADQRATIRNLENHGDVRFERPDPSDKDDVFDVLCNLQAGRQDKKAGRSFLDCSKTREMLKEGLLSDWADISMIMLDNRMISVIYGIIHDNRFMCWISGFDNEFIRHSVGKLHFKCLIEDSFAQNRSRFDMMIGGESYKLRWATGEVENYEVVIYRNRFLAMQMRLRRKIRSFLKTIKNRSGILSKFWIKLSKIKK